MAPPPSLDPTNTKAIATAPCIRDELLDSFDGKSELELDDERLATIMGEVAGHSDVQDMDRRFYFEELFRLQRDLINLQDCFVRRGKKVVVLFEGRDGAGKG